MDSLGQWKPRLNFDFVSGKSSFGVGRSSNSRAGDIDMFQTSRHRRNNGDESFTKNIPGPVAAGIGILVILSMAIKEFGSSSSKSDVTLTPTQIQRARLQAQMDPELTHINYLRTRRQW